MREITDPCANHAARDGDTQTSRFIQVKEIHMQATSRDAKPADQVRELTANEVEAVNGAARSTSIWVSFVSISASAVTG